MTPTLSLRAEGVASSLAKFQIPKSNLQTNSNIKILNVLSIGIWCWDLGFSLQRLLRPDKSGFIGAPGNDKKEVLLRY
jgi:hypothetical protein